MPIKTTFKIPIDILMPAINPLASTHDFHDFCEVTP